MNLTFAAQLNKMITAGLGGAVEAPETGVAVGRRTEYTSIGPAPILTFEANSELPLKALSVNMEPKQDLHGQDAPYPAGGGKNLLQNKATSTTTNGVTFTVNADGTVTVNGTATGGDAELIIDGGYTNNADTILNGCPSGGSLSTYAIRASGIGGEYGSGLNIPGGQSTAIYIRIASGTTVTNLLFKPMTRLSTVSDSTFAPYSNICPISGRSTVNVWRESTYDTSAEPALTIQLGQTVYGGVLDVVAGKLYSEWANIASYDGEELPGEWLSSMDVYSEGATPTTGAQVCYKFAEPVEITLTPEQLTTLIGTNNVWSDADEVSLTYGNIYYTEGY